jgi:hypothetical protein
VARRYVGKGITPNVSATTEPPFWYPEAIRQKLLQLYVVFLTPAAAHALPMVEFASQAIASARINSSTNEVFLQYQWSTSFTFWNKAAN